MRFVFNLLAAVFDRLAMATQTFTNVDKILKDDFQEGVWSQLMQETPYLNIVQKSSAETRDTGGRRALFALQIGAHQGTRSYKTDPATFVTSSATDYGECEVRLKKVYHQMEIENQVIKLADTDTDAFVNALQNEMDTLVTTLKQRLNEMLLNGDESGVILVIGTDATGPVYDVTAPWNVTQSTLGILLEKMNLVGMYFDCWAPDLSAKRANGPLDVTDYDDTEGSETLTFSDSFTASATNDVLIRSTEQTTVSTSDDPHIMGLKGIIDDFSLVDPFQAVTGSTQTGRVFRSKILNNGGTLRTLTERLMMRAYSMAAISGGDFPELIVCHPYAMDTYADLLMPDKRFMARKQIELPGGYIREHLTFNGIPFLPEADCIRNRMYFVAWKGVSLFHRDGPIGRWMTAKQGGGGIMVRIPRTPYWECVYEVFANQGSKNRRNHVLLDDLEEAGV